MSVRQRMITDEIVSSTRFTNLHQETRLLYFYLVLYADDDGVVDSCLAMKMAGIQNLSCLEELTAHEYIYPLDEDMLAFVTHFHSQNKIKPSMKVDSIYLPLLLEKFPEFKFKIVVCKNPKIKGAFSQKITKNDFLENNFQKTDQINNKINKQKNKEIANAKNSRCISMPEDTRAKLDELRKRK